MLELCYPITVEHIYISPGHNYFGKLKEGPGDHVTQDVAEVEARAGLGLRGDRYYGVPAHYEAQVTFFAAEVFDALLAEFTQSDQRDALTPILTRRNVVTRGANLNGLIGQEFVLDYGSYTMRFQGTKPCNPCAWMDAMLGKGAHAFLRGRGGLRARLLTDGMIRQGPTTLCAQRGLDMTAITAPIAKPRLP